MSEKKVKVEGQGEETVTSGCPSLGLPRLPSGFDGVEPVVKMNAEAVFGDLVDVVLKAAREAPVDRTAREAFYRTVLGDVAHAVASVAPVEGVAGDRRGLEAAAPVAGDVRSAGTSDPTIEPCATVRSAGTSDPTIEPCATVGRDVLGAPPSGKGKFNGVEMRVAKTPETVVYQAILPTGRKLSAELTSCGEAFIYDGNEAVCSVTFEGQYAKSKWSYPIVRRALNGLISVCGHRHRNNVNRSNRKGGE